MPKVALGSDAKREAKELEANKVLSDQILVCRMKVEQVAASVDVSHATISKCRKDPANVSQVKFNSVRRLAHTVGLTREQWDKLGGYE